MDCTCRLFIFETYCRIHQCIDLKMLSQKLNMDEEAAEKWIVNLIRNARLNAKIDSQVGGNVSTVLVAIFRIPVGFWAGRPGGIGAGGKSAGFGVVLRKPMFWKPCGCKRRPVVLQIDVRTTWVCSVASLGLYFHKNSSRTKLL